MQRRRQNATKLTVPEPRLCNTKVRQSVLLWCWSRIFDVNGQLVAPVSHPSFWAFYSSDTWAYRPYLLYDD